MRWRLDAPGGGRFTLVAAGDRLAVPFAAGALRLDKPLPACFRIRHDGDDGRIAYSAMLQLVMSPQESTQLAWRGNGASFDALQAGIDCRR